MASRRRANVVTQDNSISGDNIVQVHEISSSHSNNSEFSRLSYRNDEFFGSESHIPMWTQHNLNLSHDLNENNQLFPHYFLPNHSREESLRTHNENEPIEDNEKVYVGSTRSAIFTVATIFLTSLALLAWIYTSFPQLEENEKSHVKLPLDIEDAKNLGQVLNRYKDKYYIEVLALVFVTYIFLQTFAIPGSISLSILSGFLFPFPFALTLVCFCSATGASLCYLLSSVLGRKLVYKYCPQRAGQWAQTVNKHRDSILNYILFLRMTPFLPNWFINIVAPCIDVPLFPFWLGTFLGVGPPSFLAIQAGQTLHELSADKATWSWKSVSLLGLFATLSLLPVFLKNRLRRKFE